MHPIRGAGGEVRVRISLPIGIQGYPENIVEVV